MESMIQSVRLGRGSQSGEVALVNNMAPKELVDLAFSSGHRHLVQKDQNDTLREIRFARVIHKNPKLFMMYPLSSTLAPRIAGPTAEDDFTLRKFELKSHSDKADVLIKIRELFSSMRLTQTLQDDVVLTADEFCCNVLFNAIYKDGINQEDLASTLKVSQKPLTQPAILRIGANNSYFAVSCWDAYGTLDPVRVLQRLQKCLHEGAGQVINQSDHGTAGIGSYLVFNACSSLYMAVEKGVGTQFCALFPKRPRHEERKVKPKNLHWIEF